MASDPLSKTVLLVSPVTPDSAESITQTWDGSRWQVITRSSPDIGAIAFNTASNALLACGLSMYSKSVEVISKCWQWTGLSWLQELLANPPPRSNQIIIEAEVSDTATPTHHVRLAHTRHTRAAATTAHLDVGRGAVARAHGRPGQRLPESRNAHGLAR